MSPSERWRVVSELFNDALELPADERHGFLERSCDDEAVLREVLGLLAEEEHDGDSLLAQPYFSLHKTSAGEAPGIGRRIGSYRLLCRLGYGGMGTVYLAERADGEFEQKVAVKLLHPSVASTEVLRRFRGERQILAKLSHPNVAQLLDGGTTDDGFPYFVMEHVDGRPIDEHCNARGFAIRQRLGLFRSLCAAVSFAHRNLVVHRDLKPGNILVTSDDHLKLLDFGIAKLLEGQQPLVTHEGLVLMTPPYASPEQIRGEVVNTATDVYSLGVVLYELLTGRRPHQARSPEELARVICAEEPRRPSTVELGARLRAEEPKRLRRRLADDLDTIVLTSLRKEPERRFSSVEQLSEDIRRYLEGEPVLSRPDTLTYRAGKFVRRYRWSVAAAGFVAVLVAVFTISTAVQSARIARQYEEILRERDRARNVTEFLVDVLGQTDPRQAKGKTTTVRDVLDTTAHRLQTELPGEPLIRAALLDAIGRIYHSLDLDAAARPSLEEALALRRAHLAANDPVVAESLHNLAGLERSDGQLALAESLMRDAVAIQRAAFPKGHRDLARGLSNLASLLRQLGRLDEAEPLAREAIRMQERLFGHDHGELAITLNNLARILVAKDRFAEAETCYRSSAEIRRATEGADDPGLARTLNNLALLLADHLDRPGEALPLYQESLRIRRKVYGEGHSELVSNLNNLALLLTSLGRYEEASACFDEIFAIYGERPVPPDLRKNQAVLLLAVGEHAACEELTRQVLPLLDEDALIGETKSLRGACLVGLGRRAEAEPLLHEGWETLRATLGEGDRRTRQAGDRLAVLSAALIPSPPGGPG